MEPEPNSALLEERKSNGGEQEVRSYCDRFYLALYILIYNGQNAENITPEESKNESTGQSNGRMGRTGTRFKRRMPKQQQQSTRGSTADPEVISVAVIAKNPFNKSDVFCSDHGKS